MKSKLLCVIGKTATGKDSITRAAISKFPDYELHMVCSYTDRPIRDGEIDGIDHYFITTKEFNNIKKTKYDDILAYTHIKKENDPESSGYQYMALVDELKKSQIYIIDPTGLRNLKELYSDTIDIVVVYIQSPYKERLIRAKTNRSDFETEFQKRVENEEDQFKNFIVSHEFDYRINNRDGHFDTAVNYMANIIKHEFLDVYVENSPHLKPQKTNS